LNLCSCCFGFQFSLRGATLRPSEAAFERFGGRSIPYNPRLSPAAIRGRVTKQKEATLRYYAPLAPLQESSTSSKQLQRGFYFAKISAILSKPIKISWQNPGIQL